MDIWELVKKPRRVLGGMKEGDLRAVDGEAIGVEIEAGNRMNGYGPEPDVDLFERWCVARVLKLMVRAIRRNRIENEGRGNYPGRPKPASRRRGEDMSNARGAKN
ncbi:MAG: hypothetical protein AAB887_01945 [Patescibacteria group bacterium]